MTTKGYKPRRLITKKELEDRLLRQGNRRFSTSSVVVAVYYDIGKRPYEEGKAVLGVRKRGTFDSTGKKGGSGFIDQRNKIVYEVNFGEFIGNYINKDPSLPNVNGKIKEDTLGNIESAWEGKRWGQFEKKGGHAPLTKKKRVEILDAFHKTIHVYGLRKLIEEDRNWTKGASKEQVISNKKGSLGQKLRTFTGTLPKEEQQDFWGQVEDWASINNITTSMNGNPKEIIKMLYNQHGSSAHEIAIHNERIRTRERMNRGYGRGMDTKEFRKLYVALRFDGEGVGGNKLYFERNSRQLLGSEWYSLEDVLPQLEKVTGFEINTIGEFNKQIAKRGFHLEHKQVDKAQHRKNNREKRTDEVGEEEFNRRRRERLEDMFY